MAAGKQQAQHTVPYFAFQKQVIEGRRQGVFRLQQASILRKNMRQPFFAPQVIDGFVPGHAVQPSGRVIRHAAVRPDSHGLHQAVLYQVLRHLQVLKPQQA
jgi:hypothetical protein